MGLFYCFIVFDLENSKHPRDVLKKGTSALLDKTCFVQRCPLHLFLKRYRAFLNSPNPLQILFPYSGTSNRWLPGREHPSGKEFPSLEPSGKALNAGYRKKQKSLHPPQVRSMRKA